MKGMTPMCPTCHERRTSMRRVFCWLPTDVYDLHFPMYRRGFRWLSFVLRGADGRHYVEVES